MANRPNDSEAERDRDPMDEDAVRGYNEGEEFESDEEEDDLTDEEIDEE